MGLDSVPFRTHCQTKIRLQKKGKRWDAAPIPHVSAKELKKETTGGVVGAGTLYKVIGQ